MSELTTKQVKELIRHPFAWPGGYEVVFICSDGGILCHNCARENWREICDSMTHNIRDGWKIESYGAIGADMDYPSEENPLICDHCSKDFAEDYK